MSLKKKGKESCPFMKFQLLYWLLQSCHLLVVNLSACLEMLTYYHCFSKVRNRAKLLSKHIAVMLMRFPREAEKVKKKITRKAKHFIFINAFIPFQFFFNISSHLMTLECKDGRNEKRKKSS